MKIPGRRPETDDMCKLGNKCSRVGLMIERLVSQEVIAAGMRADYWLGKNEERYFSVYEKT